MSLVSSLRDYRQDMLESDRDLFVRCLAGDNAAWDRVISAHAPLVYAVARAQGLKEDQCDDVAQSVFSALVRRIASIRDAQALPAWLITSTKREAWRVRRASVKLQPGEAEPDHQNESSLDKLESVHQVRRALEELGGRCKELLTLLFLADGSPDYQVISQTLEIPVGSIGPTRARCLAKLAEMMGMKPG